MQARFTTAVLLGFLLTGLAACGGSSSKQATIDQLEADLAAAEEAREEAEEEARQATQEAAEAEEERQAAEEAAQEAEEEAEQAAQEAAEAEEQRQAAEEAQQEAEEQRQAAEAERRRLAAAAEAARQEANRADAKYALDGLWVASRIGTPTRRGEAHAGPPTMVAVIPRHGATASITPTPSWGFSSSRRSSSGGYSVTTLSNAGFTHDDELVVYSNRGPAVSIPINQEYGSTRFADGDPANAGTEIESGLVAADALLIRSGSFPSTDGTDRTYAFNYDSDPTMDAADDGNADTTTDGDGILTNDLDTARISGTFQGASGHFECTGAAACTIGRRGDRYVTVSGTWVFKTTDRATVRIEDRSYAYFGWWKRQQKSNETYSFLPFAGIAGDATTGGNATLQYSATSDTTAFNALTDSATYRGPAVGQYAIYQPLGGESSTGAFTARTELTANFDANTLSGTVTNFSNDSSWSLTLNSASMADGRVPDTGRGAVDWTIAGNTSDVQGNWDAEFYSESDYVGQVPDGVVGTFTAAFDADIDGDGTADEIVGGIVGAFGARK